MDNGSKQVSSPYTCNEYRAEMILLGLHQQLLQPGLSEEERQRITAEIARLEKIVGLA
ncbi:MAG: hypothetical protein OEL83_03935 [Desulforhopalus sp.]|nr:hypothetical protein [Desulforhopalus sp.]